MADSSAPSRRSSTASRRSLQRHASRLSQRENLIDIFSDDNSVDFMPVADGFRPASGAISGALPGSSSPPRSTSPQMPPRAASPPRATEYLKKRIAGQERGSPSSPRSSVSASQRDSMINRIPSVSAASIRSARPLSTASGLSIPASESPFTVSAGPSNSFAPYPQVSGLNRHASTSTVQTQNRPYNGPNRPTHPYAMYPQIPGSQEPAASDPFVDPADIANVGFPGLGQSYARVRGQEGEDADDLIGPDGHTEQLPPYSRFPEDMHPKARNELEDSSRPLIAAGEGSSSTTLAPAESMSDPSSSTSLLGHHDDDEATINVAAARAAGYEAPNRAQRWKEKVQKKTRWAQVPVWVWIVIVVILCALAAGLGGALGMFFAKHQAKEDDAAEDRNYPSPTSYPWKASVTPDHQYAGSTVWATVTTTLIDAQSLSSVPTGLPELKSGRYYLPFSTKSLPVNPVTMSVFDKCSDQYSNVSWQCANTGLLDVKINCDGPHRSIHLFPIYDPDTPLFYGAQAPSLRGPANLSLMEDIQDPNNGPAYFFQQLVDKMIIVRHDDMQELSAIQQKKYKPVNHSKKNSLDERSLENDDQMLSTADDNDIVESYLQERESIPLDVPFEKLQARDSTKRPQPVLTGDTLWFCFWNSTVLEGFIYMTQPNQDMSPVNDILEAAALSSMESEHGITAVASSSVHSQFWPRGAPSATPTTPPAQQTTAAEKPSILLPYNFKLEERRGAGMTTPYCQKMQAMPDGQILIPPNGATWFNITEKQPVLRDSNNSGGNSKRAGDTDEGLSRRGDGGPPPDMSCKCIWKWT